MQWSSQSFCALFSRFSLFIFYEVEVVQFVDSKIAQILHLNQRFIKISKSKKIESLLHHLSFIMLLRMISLAVSRTSAGQDILFFEVAHTDPVIVGLLSSQDEQNSRVENVMGR